MSIIPAAGGIFWGFGGVLHKNHVAGAHSGTCFRRKTPPNPKKFPPAAGQSSKSGEPPYWKRINNTEGFLRGISRRHRLIEVLGYYSDIKLRRQDTEWLMKFQNYHRERRKISLSLHRAGGEAYVRFERLWRRLRGTLTQWVRSSKMSRRSVCRLIPKNPLFWRNFLQKQDAN